MDRPDPPTLEYLAQLRPDFTPVPPLREGSPGVRFFLFVPGSDLNFKSRTVASSASVIS
jgi:hypothetical protein